MKSLIPFAVLTALAAPAWGFDGYIVFTRMGGVWQQAAEAGAKPVEIGDLPDDATEVRFVEAVESGRLVVLDLGTYPVWLYAPDAGRPAIVRGGPCTARAYPSPGGGCLVCQTRDGTMLVAGGRADQLALPGPLLEAQFLGPSGMTLGALTPDGIVSFDRRKPADKTIVAKPGAASHLLFSPDGKKGVAVFGEGDAARVRSFLLDGEGVSRQLGGPGVPTLWSWDSTWVLYEEGDIKDYKPSQGGEDGGASAFLFEAPRDKARKRKPPPKKGKRPEPEPRGPLLRACVARSTGGEVKCWDGYTGMAFNADSTLVLLKKDKSLYVGKINGVRPEPPVKIADEVDGAATWVPGVVAAPMPQGGSPEKANR